MHYSSRGRRKSGLYIMHACHLACPASMSAVGKPLCRQVYIGGGGPHCKFRCKYQGELLSAMPDAAVLLAHVLTHIYCVISHSGKLLIKQTPVAPLYSCQNAGSVLKPIVITTECYGPLGQFSAEHGFLFGEASIKNI